MYVVAVLAYKCQRGLVPMYLRDELRQPADTEARRRSAYSQRIWVFDVLVCPLSATKRFLLQPLVDGIVFHCTSLLSSLSVF